jgi:hypothetical protein
MPSDRLLYRLAAALGLIGGLADAFATYSNLWLSPFGDQLLYYFADLLMTPGLIGVWLFRRERTGLAGLVAAAGGLSGFMLIRSGAAFGGDTYQYGATIVALSCALIALPLMRDARFRIAAGLWIAAVAIGLLVPLAPALGLRAVAHLSFGLGFVAASIALWRAAGSSAA